MKKDIFIKGKWGNIAFIILVTIVIAASFLPLEIRNLIYTSFFFINGAFCLWNYKGCGRIHCQITGWGFLAIGMLAILNVLTIINISWLNIWLIYIVILAIGFGIEFMYKSKTGSCYKV